MAVRTFGPLRMGWRFWPKDEELIAYLREKNAGKQPEIEEIPDVDIYKFEPEDLPGKSLIKTEDLEWFFFSPFKRKYQRGCRKHRMTNTGYWKVTGKDRNIKSRSSKLIGKKRTLVFYEGRAPSYERTNWIAHEYQTIENGVNGKKCEEVETQVQSSKNSDQPECSSPLGYEFLSPLNQNIYAGMGHNPKSPLSSDNFGTGQQLVFDDYSSNWDFIRASLQGLSSPSRVADYKLSGKRLCASTTSSNDTDSQVAAPQVTIAEGPGSGSINSLAIDAFHDMLPNHTESYSEEYPTNGNNIVHLNMIYVKEDGPDSSKNAGSIASKPHILRSRGSRLMEKTHRKSMFRELCGEDHRVTTATIVGIENGAVATRVNGGLCSTELEEELEKRLATLQLADKTQAEASHNLEGKQKQIPSMMTVQAEERCEGIRG